MSVDTGDVLAGTPRTTSARVYDQMLARRTIRRRITETKAKADALGLMVIDGTQVSTDIPCPNDAVLVNIGCWQCGWQRSPIERKATIDAAKAAGLVPAWLM
jgi:hypothetical protein